MERIDQPIETAALLPLPEGLARLPKDQDREKENASADEFDHAASARAFGSSSFSSVFLKSVPLAAW